MRNPITNTLSPYTTSQKALIFLFLLAILLQTTLSSYNLSLSYDEPLYIGVGKYIFSTGDFHYLDAFSFHPPLSFYLNSIFLQFLDFPDDAFKSDKSIEISLAMIFHSGYNPFLITFLARLPFMLLSLIFAILILNWTRELYGAKSSLLAMLLYAFSITMLHNSSIALTDFTVTFFIFATMYALWKYCQKKTLFYAAITGVLFGLALLSKLTAVILIPLFALLLLSHVWKKHSFGRKYTFQTIEHFLIIFLIGAVVVWAGYGFTISTLKEAIPSHYANRAYEEFAQLPKGVEKNLATFAFEKIPLPAPGYVFGLTAVVYRSAQEGREGFFLGEVIQSPPWYYFPTVFLLKTQLSFIILLTFSAIFFFKNKDKNKKTFFDKEIFLLVPIILLFILFIQNKMVSGIAHILPAYPFLIVFASMLGQVKQRIYQFLILLICLHYFLSAVFAFPNYHSYFNEAVGGPKNGHKYLGGGNLQNGQHLPEIQEYMAAQGILKVNLSLLGSVDPKEYGISYDYMPSPHFQPWVPEYVPYAKETTTKENCSRRKGWVVVDSNSLQGVFLNNRSCYSWLKNEQPYAVLSDNVFVYHIPS